VRRRGGSPGGDRRLQAGRTALPASFRGGSGGGGTYRGLALAHGDLDGKHSLAPHHTAPPFRLIRVPVVGSAR
jgi:hypothetical protein